MSGRNELCKPKFLFGDNAEIYHEASSHWLKEVLEILFYFFKIQEFMTQRNIEKKSPEMVFILMHEQVLK